MHDGVRDFDAGGEAVDDDAAGDGFEAGDERRVLAEFGIGAVDGRGEVAVQGAEDGVDFTRIGAPDDERARAEDFFLQRSIGDEGLGFGGEERGDGAVGLAAGLALGDHLDASLGGAGRDAFLVGLMDAGSEHDAVGAFREEYGELADEGFRGGGAGQDDQTGLRAELTDAEGARAEQAGGDGFAACGEGAFEQDDRIDAAHLGVDRDRSRTGGSGVHQGTTAHAGAGEADGAEGRVLGDLLADDASFAHQERERAFRKTGGLHGFDDEPAHDFGGADVRVVGHHDDRAACGESGSGVAAGDGVGEGEVARAEDGDGADGTEQRAVVGLGQRLAVRVRGLDAGVDPIAFLDEVGEETQLAHGAADLTLATRLGEAGLLRRAGDEGGRGGFDPGGDVAEEGGLLLAGEGGQDGGGLGGQGAGLVCFGRGGGEEVRLQGDGGGGVDGAVRRGAGLAAGEADEREAEEGRHRERSGDRGGAGRRQTR